MPELPEVETVRQTLRPALVGRRIVTVWHSGKALRLGRPVPIDRIRTALVDRTVVAVDRIAKYLVWRTDADDAALVHLGMSGRLKVSDQAQATEPHTHLIFRLDADRFVHFVDPRRFGQVDAHPWAEMIAAPPLAGLGPDPLSPAFSPDRFFADTRGRARPIKHHLMDQRTVAGFGNIYASEALFASGIHPARPAGSLSRGRSDRLHDAIVSVLRAAIRRGGTTLRDHRSADGKEGRQQHHLKVYGRAEQDCPSGDGGRIRRLEQQQRSTFYCPRCQR